MEDSEMTNVASSVPIFEYHDLSDDPGDTNPFHAPYNLARKKFYEQMKWLHDNRYRAITLDDFFEKPPQEKTVVLTFDDGHISNYEIAYPILKHFNFKAVFFIVTGFINKEDHLTRDHIREMQEDGMRFGSHTSTHPYMLSLSRAEMTKEILQSRTELGNFIGSEVHHFSIPYGFYNKSLINCVREAGYKSLITEDFGYYKPNKNEFKIFPRFTVKASISAKKFINIADKRKFFLFPEYCIETIIQATKDFLGFRNYIRLKSLLLKTSIS